MSIYEMELFRKKIARAAFDKAYQREIREIINTLKEKVTHLKSSPDVWELHEYLYKQQKEVDEKYDYRYSKLILVFSKLIAQNFLLEEDIECLSEDKKEIIVNLSLH